MSAAIHYHRNGLPEEKGISIVPDRELTEQLGALIRRGFAIDGVLKIEPDKRPIATLAARSR